MKKVIGFIMLSMLMLVGFGSPVDATEKGKIRVSTDVEDAYIYVNGMKKATAGDGYTNILLPEGEYEIKVEKLSSDGNWIHRGVKNVFIGSDTSVKITVNTQQIPTEKKIQEDADKKAKAHIERKPKVQQLFSEVEFALIQPGTFLMGSASDEPLRDSYETQYQVAISKPFYLQTTEVTQEQWETVMGANPSKFKNCGNECPVEQVSWNDIQDFIKKLNEMTDKKYRLPTEAEWEYACRAGTDTPFHTGVCLEANYNGNDPMPGCSKGKYNDRTVPAASYPPNAWGLYDMHGNVWEWCQDLYGDYPSGQVTDPEGPSSGKLRVVRGGGWYFGAKHCRSASRSSNSPGFSNSSGGFRLLRLTDQ